MMWLGLWLPLAISAPSAGLSPSEILAAIEERRPELERQCLPVRPKGAPSVLRVTARIRIDERGFVVKSEATGAEAIPSLAPCVAKRVGTWRFPVADESTSLVIPFKFRSSEGQ